MKILPLILSRSAAFSTRDLALFRWPDDSSRPFYTFFELHSHIKSLKSSINDSLKLAIEQEPNYAFKSRLSNFRADLFNGRRWRADRLKGALSGHHLLFDQLEELRQMEDVLAMVQSELEQLYEEKLAIARQHFLQLFYAKDEQLLKGLLLSSHSFYQRVLSYRQKPIAAFRKKERQTERSLLQYLSRMAAKTTPFSTFTHIDLYNWEAPVENREYKISSHFQLNNVILAHLQELLEQYPPFFRSLSLQRNETIELFEEQFRYLINSHNLEAFQYMERSGILDFIYGLTKEVQPFGKLMQKALEEIDSDSEELEDYLMQLLAFGFLEWRWPRELNHQGWAVQLGTMLREHNDPLLQRVGEQLLRLEEDGKKLSVVDSEERFRMLRRAQEDWNDCVRTLWDNIDIYIREDGPTAFQRLNDFDFQINAEKIFYEDCTRPTTPLLPQKDTEELVGIMEQLLEALWPVWTPNRRMVFTAFFKKHYKPGAVIRLLDFYEQFYREEGHKAPYEEPMGDLKGWAERLHQLLPIKDQTDEINISLTTLQSLSGFTDPNRHYSSPSKSALLQVIKTPNDWKAYTDVVVPGFGRMMGRFLHLFPEAYTEKVKQANEELPNSYLWVANCDSSFFNANLQPALLDYELRMPGSRNKLPKAQQMSINQLFVRMNEDLGILELGPIAGPPLRVVNMGLEALGSRSRLYQMLAAFGPMLPSFDPIFLQFPPQERPTGTSETMFCFPRITIADKLVIRRKYFTLSKPSLPLQQGQESDAQYFIRIQQWYRRLGLPTRVYLTLAPKSMDTNSTTSGTRSDDYKPQYMDFESPLFVQLLARMLKRVPNVLKIEEALPDWQFGVEHLQEVLVQWESH